MSSPSSSPSPLEYVTASRRDDGTFSVIVKFVGEADTDCFEAILDAYMTREEVSNMLFALSSSIRLRGLGAPGTMPSRPA